MAKIDGRKNNGGHSTKGKAGRKPKAQEEQAAYLINRALVELYNKKGASASEDAKIEFIKELIKTPRGQIFIGEHVLGKAPQTLEVNQVENGSIPVNEWILKRK